MTNLIEILRIEAVLGDRVGVGPYQQRPYQWPHDEAHDEGFALAPGNAARPTPAEDPDRDTPIGIREEEVCGFVSEEQLFAWFPPEAVRAFCRTGYYAVVRYTVPALYVRVGEYQVVFNRYRFVDKRRVILDAVGLPDELRAVEQETAARRTPSSSDVWDWNDATVRSRYAREYALMERAAFGIGYGIANPTSLLSGITS